MIFINGSGNPFTPGHPVAFEYGSGIAFNRDSGVGSGFGYGRGYGHSSGCGFGSGHLQRSINRSYPYELILFKK